MDDSSAKKNKLEELVNRKRKEQEEAAEQERQERLKKLKESEIDFGDDSDGEDAPSPAAQPKAATQDGVPDDPIDNLDDIFGDEDDEGDLVPNERDHAFIDDEGVPQDDRIDFGDDDDPDEQIFDEAEEAAEDMDELDRLFGRNKRKQDDGNSHENRATIDNLLAQMEAAVEMDIDAVQNGKPAIHKLRMLKHVEDVLSMKKLHGDLLDSGLLDVLYNWINLMPDGSLPNSKIRSSVLSLLTKLPIDCAYEDRRDQLKRSNLGKIVMFLSKVPDETAENKKIARNLVEKWSRPILAPHRGGTEINEEENARILEARKQRTERAKQQEIGLVGDEDDAAARARLRPGQPGFRFHASLPQSASLDYVKMPASKVMMVGKSGNNKASEHKLSKKLNTLNKKTSSRAANVSIEGRNVNYTV